MNKYKIKILPLFEKRFKKFSKKDKNIKDFVLKTLNQMLKDPFHKSLKTHKVNSKILEGVFSSRITGDLRIIWGFNQEEKDVIDIYDMGGHEGGRKVYN